MTKGHHQVGAASPLSIALNAIGDRWTLRIVQEALEGRRRFGDFQRNLGPFAGKRQGRGAVGEFFSTLARLQDARSFEEREFIAQADKVVVLGHYVWKVKANGRTIEGDFAHVFTVRGGQIVAFHEYMDSAAVPKAYR